MTKVRKRERVRLRVVGTDGHYRVQTVRRDAEIPHLLISDDETQVWVEESGQSVYTQYGAGYRNDRKSLFDRPEPRDPSWYNWSPSHGALAFEGQGLLPSPYVELRDRFKVADKGTRREAIEALRLSIVRPTQQLKLAKEEQHDEREREHSNWQKWLAVVVAVLAVACVVIAGPTILEALGGIVSGIPFDLGFGEIVGGFFGGEEATSG